MLLLELEDHVGGSLVNISQKGKIITFGPSDLFPIDLMVNDVLGEAVVAVAEIEGDVAVKGRRQDVVGIFVDLGETDNGRHYLHLVL